MGKPGGAILRQRALNQIGVRGEPPELKHHQVVFRVGGWSPRLPTGFHVSRGTLDPASQLPLSDTGLSPAMAGLPMPFS